MRHGCCANEIRSYALGVLTPSGGWRKRDSTKDLRERQKETQQDVTARVMTHRWRERDLPPPGPSNVHETQGWAGVEAKSLELQPDLPRG